MFLSLREKAAVGALVVSRRLCEHPTKGKKKQVLWGGAFMEELYSYKGWHSQRNIQERKSWQEKLGRAGCTGLCSEQ